MIRADSTTSAVARRIIVRIRALSPTTLTAAINFFEDLADRTLPLLSPAEGTPVPPGI